MLLLANHAYNKNNRCQEIEGEKEGRKWKKREVNEWCGRKEVHRDKTLTGREREGAVNFLPSVSVLLGCCYVRAECTHTDYLRSVELITWGAPVPVCVWARTWVHVCEHTIPLSYISRTKTRTHILYRQHTYKLLSRFKRAQIIHPRCRVARGFPKKWQLHWLTITPPQYPFDDTHIHAHLYIYNRSDIHIHKSDLGNT